MWLLVALVALFSCPGCNGTSLRAAAVITRAWFQSPVRDVTGEQCDFARFSLYIRNGVFKALRALGANMVVGASTIRYRRPLCVGEGFELRSRVVTWDDKGSFSTKDGLVCAPVMYCRQKHHTHSPDKVLQYLCKRKVECPEFPEDLQHWVNFISASSQALRAEGGLEEKTK
ncbi:hypothetical protein CRUP_012607 [Coryphaenoides rupestris]|nr:hypothetical protein CRUP_012607 [Coryphaenoides rupestris]